MQNASTKTGNFAGMENTSTENASTRSQGQMQVLNTQVWICRADICKYGKHILNIHAIPSIVIIVEITMELSLTVEWYWTHDRTSYLAVPRLHTFHGVPPFLSPSLPLLFSLPSIPFLSIPFSFPSHLSIYLSLELKSRFLIRILVGAWSGIWGEALAEVEFDAFTLKSVIRLPFIKKRDIYTAKITGKTVVNST